MAVIDTKVAGKVLTITVNLEDANFKASRSGKTQVISTGGNVAIAGTELKLGLNVMKKVK